MNKNEFPQNFDLVFRDFEISPCKEFTDGNEKWIETVDSEPEIADFWTVYGQLTWGGVEALADCPTKTVAEMVMKGLQITHNPKCPECGSHDNYVDASDGFFRICNACGTNFEVEPQNCLKD